MTRALQQTEQIATTRTLWIDALKQQGYRQCLGWGAPMTADAVCALSLLSEITGVLPDYCNSDDADDVYQPLYDALGTSRDLGGRIWRDNDGKNERKWTFAQIASGAEIGRYWNIVKESGMIRDSKN